MSSNAVNSIETILKELGFPASKIVQGRASVADVYRVRRCGIYVLHFANNEYYVGQSIDVVKRYAQHRHTYKDIERISFKQVSRGNLNAEENMVTRALESSGFFLRNINLVTFSHAKTDFDLIMSPEEQERWLDNLDYQDMSGERVIDDDLRRRYAVKFQQLVSMPFAAEVLDVLKVYVRNCIPAVKRGEIGYWGCTCLPVVRKSVALYCRINIGWQTTFDAWVMDNKCVYQWYVTREFAEEILDCSLDEVDETDLIYKVAEDNNADWDIWITKSSLSKGGQDQVRLQVEDTKNAFKLLDDPYMLMAVRLFNLGLMQKSTCPWGKNHCLDLADRLIED